MESRVSGRSLGSDTFQFKFSSEADLLEVLSKALFHFRKWMLILQRWEPIISTTFPSSIAFWVKIHGIPLHHCTDNAIRAIAKPLGKVRVSDANNARVRVEINGLQPLEMSRDIQLHSGEVLPVEFEYEKLEKHCFSCFSLSHEKDNCPLIVPESQRAPQPLGINQQKILNRLEADKRRLDERKSSRGLEPRQPHTHSSLSRQDLRSSLRDRRAPLSFKLNRPEWTPLQLRDTPSHRSTNPRSHNQSLSPSRPPGFSRQRPSQPHQDHRRLCSSRVSERSVTQYESPKGRVIPHGSFNNSHKSQSSHTPSPIPQREPITLDLRTEEFIGSSRDRRPALERIDDTNGNSRDRRPALERIEESNGNSGDRRSALERISTRDPSPIPRVGNSLDSNKLQDVVIGMTDEIFPASITHSGEKRLPASHRLGPILPPSLAHKAKGNSSVKPGSSKAPTKTRVSKASSSRKIARSPLQGASLRKVNATRTNQPSRKRLQLDPSILPPALPCNKDLPVSNTVSNTNAIPASPRRGADFQSPPPPLP